MSEVSAVMDWKDCDVVLLDMDGTLLDLHFDNWFWTEHLPAVYAANHGIPLADVQTQWANRFTRFESKLEWYCIDHWSRELQLDVARIKRDVQHRVRWLPGAQDFLKEIQRRGLRRLLVTNAHPMTLAIKNEIAEVAPWFDACYSSHEFGVPKEDQRFWPLFQSAAGIEPARCLFIDDSVSVLRAARAFGIGHLVAIRLPDSKQPARAIDEFRAVDRLTDLISSAATIPTPIT